MADVDLNGGDVRIRVEGLRRTLRAMEAAGTAAGDMKDLMHSLGQIVVDAANVPTGATGKLSATPRAGRGKTKAVVRAGGARTPYAGVIHYGWPARNIAPQPFLVDALRSTRGDVFTSLDAGIAELLRQANLT